MTHLGLVEHQKACHIDHDKLRCHRLREINLYCFGTDILLFLIFELEIFMSLQFAKGKTKFIAGINSPEQMESWLKDNSKMIGIAVVGRSNVGKSSLINSMFGKTVARVSKTPGRTRQINIFSFEFESSDGDVPESPCPMFLFDLPGYGHASVSREMSKNWDQLMTTFFANGPSSNICLLNIQDARHPDQGVDKEFGSYIKQFGFEIFLLLNKIDKLKTQKERSHLNKIKMAMLGDYKWVRQIYNVSAEKGSGLNELSFGIISFLLGRFKLF